MRRTLFSLALLVPALFSATAQAETPNAMETMVVTATMTEKRLADAPGSVEVITTQDIVDLNALNVAEALESATGLIVGTESGRIQVPSIRGARSKHTLVLLDGRRLAFGYNDMVDLRQIPTVLIERIEIIRGPGSALYGSDALGGVINIITKKAPKDLTAKATGQYGTNVEGEGQEFVAGGYLGGSVDRFRALVATEIRHKADWDRDDTAPDDGFSTEPAFLAGRFVFDATDNHSLSGGVEYMQNTYAGDQFYENLTRERTADEDRTGYYLQYDAKILDTDRILLRANRSEYGNTIDFTPYVLSGDRQTEQNVNQLEARYSGLFFQNHLFTLGGEFRREGLDDTQAGVTTDDAVENLSVFLQDEFQILEPLSLVLSLRYDSHSEFGDHWSPRASVIYSPLDNLRLKASWGQGFRAPSLTELFVTTTKKRGKEVYAANADLQEEEATTYEIGIEGEYGDMYGGVTAFRTEVDNLIESVFDRTTGKGSSKVSHYSYENIAEATLQGIEAQAGAKLPLGFSLDTTMLWLDVDNTSGGEDIGGHPEFKAYAKLGYSLPEHRVRANVHTNFVGRMTYSDGDQESYTTCGARVSKALNDNLELFAGAENIFGTRLKRNDVEQIEPTTIYAGLTLKF